MAEGLLKCVGSSLFLKQRHGNGYTLAVTKTTPHDAHELAAFVLERVPEALVTSNVGTEISFRLPARQRALYAALFRELELEPRIQQKALFGQNG